jgi:CubicO group peptidase (beta-lactamase class C family)
MKRIITNTLILLLISIVSAEAQISKKDFAAIDQMVNKAFSTFKPTGMAVAIMKDSAIIYHKALGMADASRNEPVTTTSLFNIASCSKAFTAASIGMLVDEGKIKWTDKVIQYFPEFRLADDYITREMTVEDLLAHHSGLGTFFGDLLWYNTDYTDAEVMRRIRFEPITRRFGIEYGYQNVMFLVAGRIVEKVSGMSWSDFVESRIFTPLGMTLTRPSNDDLSKGQQIAYGHLNNKPLGIYDFNAAKAAAGIYSNVDELSTWTMMLMNKGVYKGHRMISASTLSRIMEPHTIIGASASQKQHGIEFYDYGLGWFLFNYNGRKIVEHDGGMPGYISKVTMVPAEKLSIIILNNGNDFFVNNALRGDLLDILIKGNDFDWIGEYAANNSKYELAKQMALKNRLESRVQGTNPSHKPAEYTGTFRDKSYGDAEIKIEGDSLRLTFLPAKNVFTGNLKHWHYDTFRVDFRDEYLTYGLVTFSFDASGKVTSFKIDLPSDDFHFWNLDFRKL